jgi:microcystin-dependent protein
LISIQSFHQFPKPTIMKASLFTQMAGVAAIACLLTLTIQSSVVERPTPVETVADEGMIGEIRLFAGNFAPRGWALCDGQLLPIAQNTALFSILGTTYGGDGRTTFQLPDLRGRVPMHPGTGPGLSTVRLGQPLGTESISTSSKMMPSGSGPQQNMLSGSSIDNRQPSLGLNYIICLQGIFPSRS